MSIDIAERKGEDLRHVLCSAECLSERASAPIGRDHLEAGLVGQLVDPDGGEEGEPDREERGEDRGNAA